MTVGDWGALALKERVGGKFLAQRKELDALSRVRRRRISRL